METCYKAVRTDLLKSIPIVSNDFRLEPELAIKLAKRDARIFEVPISYSGRTYQEGKKINWRDGVRALGAIARFWWSDEIYQNDEYGSQDPRPAPRAPQLQRVDGRDDRAVLRTARARDRQRHRPPHAAADPAQHYVAPTSTRCTCRRSRLLADRPYLDVTRTDVTDADTFPRIDGGFDTVICLNVIEHVDDDVEALRNIRSAARGRVARSCWCRRGRELMGTLDEVLGHKRRYTRDVDEAGGARGLRAARAAAVQPRRHAGG